MRSARSVLSRRWYPKRSDVSCFMADWRPITRVKPPTVFTQHTRLLQDSLMGIVSSFFGPVHEPRRNGIRVDETSFA